MAFQTYFVVQPFAETKRGGLVALPVLAAKDADQARRLAQRQHEAVGAIVFSRRADPEAGEYEDAVVLLRLGRVPEEDAAAAA